MSIAKAASPLRVGLVQMAMADDRERNLAQAIAMIREAAERGASLVCLPELFLSRYFCQAEDPAHFALAESVPGPTTTVLSELAGELELTIVASLFERRTAGLFHNTAVVVDGRRGYLGKYRKMHIPDDPRYYEKYYFAPGDLGFQCFATAAGAIGTLVCWDQWYPEAARLTALRGAQLLVYPTAIGWHPEERAALGERQHDAWQTMQRSHAVANGCFVVAVNRTGFEPGPDGSGIHFWGQSFVVAPDGRLLARAAIDEETVLVVDIDYGEIESMRLGWPFFRDRRIDAYAGLGSRFLDAEAGD
jgi:N-carbamoylputrescine amidase